MTSKARDIFIDGLRNAHAMETQARELMERQSERLTDYPDVKNRVHAHLQETEGQLKRLEQCLSSLSIRVIGGLRSEKRFYGRKWLSQEEILARGHFCVTRMLEGKSVVIQ